LSTATAARATKSTARDRFRGGERGRAGEAAQHDEAYDHVPGHQRDKYQGVGPCPARGHRAVEARVGGYLLDLVFGHGSERWQEDRQAGRQAPADQLRGVGFTPCIRTVFRKGRQVSRPPQGRLPEAHFPVVCLRCVLVTVDDGGQQVDSARVGQPRDGYL
jgi:hypothetical protein